MQASERGSRARDFKGGDHISFVFFSYFLLSVVLINSRLCCALVVVIGRREKQRRAETKVDDKDDDAREREREMRASMQLFLPAKVLSFLFRSDLSL